MRFLSEHERTKPLLRAWAGDSRLVIANFFFWNAGNTMQKSRRGLMRGLLYQLVAETDDAALDGVAADRRTGDDAAWRRPWTRPQLMRALQSLVNDLSPGCRFCFFVDGLDEYDWEGVEEGGHDELMHYLQSLAASPFVKVCVSSRPRTAFTEAIERLGRFQFAMQELTSRDMEVFVRGCLEGNPRFQQMLANDAKATELIKNICYRADGVFLWVALAVKDVANGLTEQDNLQTLLKRIKRLPQDLEKLLERIFQAIQSSPYALLAARTFLVTLIQHNFETEYHVLQFSYLEELARDPQSAVVAPPHPLGIAELRKRLAYTKQSLHKWCKDLLEIKEEPGEINNANNADSTHLESGVSFSHRTVFDFIKAKSDSAALAVLAGEDFDPMLEKARMMLYACKSLECPHLIFECASELLYHLGECGEDLVDYYEPIFESLDKAGTASWLGLMVDNGVAPLAETEVHWSHAMEDLDDSILAISHSAHSAVSMALRLDLSLLARRALAREADVLTAEQLQYVFSLALAWRDGDHPDWRVDRDIIQIILDTQSKLDINEPNLSWNGHEYSVWQLFISGIVRRDLTCKDACMSLDDDWIDITWALAQLLRLGADADVTIHYRDMWCPYSPEMLFKSVISQLWPLYGDRIPAIRLFGEYERFLGEIDHPNKCLLVDKFGELKTLLEQAVLEPSRRKRAAPESDQEPPRLRLRPWLL